MKNIKNALIKTAIKNRVAIVQLHRPNARNALNTDMLNSLLAFLEPLDQRNDIGCILITGTGGIFAAGADIKEMSAFNFDNINQCDYFAKWERFSELRTPKIAAVEGYALGGGCELAMMCDIIYAADNAYFGQPEITLGVMPGIGGTQRLTHLVGKSKAMQMILTGEKISAIEAERIGLISRVLPAESLLNTSQKTAEKIASFSKLATVFCAEAINMAQDTNLHDGLRNERRLFHSLFSNNNQQEGMQAFIEKRKPVFINE